MIKVIAVTILRSPWAGYKYDNTNKMMKTSIGRKPSDPGSSFLPNGILLLKFSSSTFIKHLKCLS